jgi:copper(I)-binding protein
MIKKISVLSILLMFVAQIAISQETIIINDAWVRGVPPGSSVSAAYMTIQNKGDDDQLIAISSDVSENAELHTSKVDDSGVATMEMINVLDIPSGQTVEFKPGGMHIMLIGLKESLVSKEIINLTLEFSKAGRIQTEVPIKKSAGEPHHHHD